MRTTSHRATVATTWQPEAGSTQHAVISRWLENARIRLPTRPAQMSAVIPGFAQTSTACRHKYPETESLDGWNQQSPLADPSAQAPPSRQNDQRQEERPSPRFQPAQGR